MADKPAMWLVVSNSIDTQTSPSQHESLSALLRPALSLIKVSTSFVRPRSRFFFPSFTTFLIPLFFSTMSESLAPPFTPLPPGVHLDGAGTPWFCDADGNWKPLQTFQPTQGIQPPPALARAPQTPWYRHKLSLSRLPTTSHPRSLPICRRLRLNKSRLTSSTPTLLPRPDDTDLAPSSSPGAVANAPGLKAAAKVSAPSKRGRKKGSPNFSTEDINYLLDCIEAELPFGGRGWKSIESRYNKWAGGTKRPQRFLKSLEDKYKTRAKRIEGLINERFGTRDLSDNEFADDADVTSDDSVEILSNSAQVHTACPELVTKLSKALDPEAQVSRDEQRFERSFQSTQFFAISQQLRDSQAVNETLRSQLSTLQSRIHEAERARDRAELKLEFSGLTAPVAKSRHRSLSSKPSRYKDYPDIARVGGKLRYESESEKENHDPNTHRSPSPLDLSYAPSFVHSSSPSFAHSSSSSVTHASSSFVGSSSDPLHPATSGSSNW
ncbi:hypothetical protein B0H17DRAFT_1218027 [Mycena rosella]|uniref:Uncharacterized protein n=1 Tax=Mycena rosella TaxID=1033263 RepID=A0AAD7BTT7_MYCRO|nr:hypothetical protein B0H17DRAFT_1218027 [Mycena rosella]